MLSLQRALLTSTVPLSSPQNFSTVRNKYITQTTIFHLPNTSVSEYYELEGDKFPIPTD